MPTNTLDEALEKGIALLSEDPIIRYPIDLKEGKETDYAGQRIEVKLDYCMGKPYLSFRDPWIGHVEMEDLGKTWKVYGKEGGEGK